MSLTINSHTMGIKNSNNITKQKKELDNTVQRLASGKRINVAADDVAGMSISNGLNAKIRSLQQARRNAGDAISFIQSSEGYLQTIQNNVTRMLELSIQAANETLSEHDRVFICAEYQKIIEANEHIIGSAKYGSIPLLNGTMGDLEFQIGSQNTTNDRLLISMDVYAVDPDKIRPQTLVDTKENAQQAISVLQNALDYISEIRSNLGAAQSRLQSTIDNLGDNINNKVEANSRLEDADYAKQSTEYVKNNIIAESSTSVLGQANQSLTIAGRLI